MAKLPVLEVDPTLEAVDAAIVARHAASQERRPYLGMSAVGQDCKRAVWYGFRWAAIEKMTADSIKRIEDGHAGEAIMAARLKATPGIELVTHDARGKQFGFSDMGGHLRGHMDGAIRGLIQAPKAWQVWEAKVVGEDNFKKFIGALGKHGSKGALIEWNATYYVQAQLYMHYSGMDRHYTTVSSAGSRKALSARTELDKAFAVRVIAIAAQLIESTEPPTRIADDATKYPCAYCTHVEHCHGKRAPLMNCRTCTYVTPKIEGGWHCAKHGLMLTDDMQGVGCIDHLYIPSLLAYADPIDADDKSVTYRHRARGFEFKNGPDDWPSSDLQHLDESFLDDARVQSVLTEFEGSRVVEATS